MKSKYSTFILYLLILSASVCATANTSALVTGSAKNNYLSKPTGQYGVGFEDFHWINQNICPDPFFNGKNKNDFSPGNSNYCHEVVVRIYYPTTDHHKPFAFYYRPFIEQREQDILSQLPNIPKNQIAQLRDIKSFSIEKAEIFKGKNFPVLLFSPGGGYPAELYENFITNLVSNGYIVLGINTPFVNFVELPNGHLVKLGNTNGDADVEKISVPLQSNDLIYVYHKIYSLHHSDALFFSMDLKNIGLFGHSMGARVLADVSHTHPSWFQAAVTLDIGFDSTNASRKKFNIPFMHAICASRKSEPPSPIRFELGKNGYLVVFSPNEQNHDYSQHINFSDLSTLQYLSAFQAFNNHLEQGGGR